MLDELSCRIEDAAEAPAGNTGLHRHAQLGLCVVDGLSDGWGSPSATTARLCGPG